MVRRREIAPPGWPAALDGLTVACVSDLHAGAPHVGPQRIADVVERTNALRPDVVAILGDVVDRHVRGGTRVHPLEAARRLAPLDARLGVYAVLGNHDWASEGGAVARALADAGITVLEDEAVEATDGLHVAGVGDLRMRGADPEKALSAVPDGAAVLMLSHDPDVFPRIPRRVSLTLSGHTHGGQINVPGLRTRVVPSRHGMRYGRGHVVEDGRHLFVTSGVGTSGWAIRARRPPEIALLRLRARTGSR